MLAVAGNVLAEIRIQGANGLDIGTANFILAVEKAPIGDDAVYSDSDIPAILCLRYRLKIPELTDWLKYDILNKQTF
jgi:hypothetical protein